MAKRLLLTAATLFACVEFAMLIIACLAQFEPGFSTQEAVGIIGAAFISACVATLLCGVARFTTGKQSPWPLRIAIVVWSGFAALILLGIVLHDGAAAARSTVAVNEPHEAASETLSDLAGTWQIREIVPASGMEPAVVASYQRFSIVLRSDGAMVARDVPENMFPQWPASDEYSGTWRIDWKPEENTTGLMFELRGPDGETGSYGTRLGWRRMKRAILIHRQGALMYVSRIQ